MAYNYLKKIAYFYPRPPRGGRLDSDFRSLWDKLFLSTPSARRATWVERLQNGIEPISIHALREEGDVQCERPGKAGKKFLSTPSARRATIGFVHAEHVQHDFYPRPPRGGRQAALVDAFYMALFLSTPSARRATLVRLIRLLDKHCISIHALREEGDTKQPMPTTPPGYFYPRPPRGGRLGAGP